MAVEKFDLCHRYHWANYALRPSEGAAIRIFGGRVTTSRFGGVGRPSKAELDRQRQEFLRLVAAGNDFDTAAREARIKPERALKLLSHPDIRPLLARLA